MLRSLRCMALVGLMTTMITLSGCPVTGPDLSVTPLALNFGVNENTKTIRIQNQGSGTLDWEATVSEGAPWLTLELVTGTKQAQSVEGQSTTEVDTIELAIDRAVLAESTSRNATVVVTSNGGTQSIGVGVSDGGPAVLQIAPAVLNFGSTTQTMNLTIGNTGFEALNWELSIPEETPWLSASLVRNTNVLNGAADSIAFTVNRAGIAGGNYSAIVPVTSNGGAGQITISMSVPPIAVSTNSLDFGTLTQPATRTFTITNPSTESVGVQLTVAHSGTGVTWFDIVNPITELDPQDSVSIQVAGDPATLEPGIYTGTITVTAAAQSFTHTIAVSMEVPAISVSPSSIDFGEITEPAERAIEIENLTANPLTYRVVVEGNHPWLSLSPESGTLAGAQTIDVNVDPEAAAAGLSEAEVIFEFGTAPDVLIRTVSISMSRPESPRLEASPKSIIFGTALNERSIAIWNVGIGSVDWQINSSAFPAWLSLEPVDGSGIAEGTVSGDTTDEVVLRVNRELAPADVFELSYTFNIVASGDATNIVTIDLSASIAQFPEFVLEADSVDDRGISTLLIPEAENSRTFVIKNTGAGSLDWRFGELPSWIASISPAQGSLEAGTQQTITLSVDREGLVTPGPQVFLEITTNDPNNEVVLFDVALNVPPVITIGTLPNSIAFNAEELTELLAVANFGDPGTILNYQAVTNVDWLAIAPATGRSEGTTSTIKDFQEHSVTVDRSRLDGEGSTARIIISGILVEDGVTIPDPSITPVEVTVTVEAAPLTIESAVPRMRVPSQVRSVLMMRNVRSESIAIPDSQLTNIGNLFRISESEVPLELTETNQFLKKDYSANILVLLDFSGSMLSSANAVAADGQLGDPSLLTDDALTTIYQRTVPALLDELPDHYRIGLGIFNDHARPESGIIRMHTNNDGEPGFTRDKAILAGRIGSLDVNDNGATDFLPAVLEAAGIVQDEDLNDNLRPFHDADVKGVIVVSDGRDTSLERVAETANTIASMRTRLFMVGWGQNVVADPMIRLSSTTGGHYYSTDATPTGEFDPFGVPIRIPQVSELSNLFSLNAADECDESIPNDLDSQVVLSYTTLNRQTSVVIAADITFDDPNDQSSACLPDQEDISSGVEYAQQDLSLVAGDLRLGQISLRSEGIENGEATVFVRADYMPRNITEMAFTISLTTFESPTLTVSRVSQVADGLIFDWDLVEGPAGTYTVTSPDGEPLRFSDFGDLLALRISGVTQPFTVNFEVTRPEYDGSDFETKYFTHPDSILVGGGSFLGTSFPAAFFDSRPDPLDLDGEYVVVADNDTDQVEIDVYNLGGGHVPEGAILDPITGEYDPLGVVNVGLFWEAALGSESSFLSFQENTPQSGFVTSTFSPSTMFINLDRASIPPGPRVGEVIVNYGSGSVNSTGTLDPLEIRYTIQNPVFSITTADPDGNQVPIPFINMGFDVDDQEIRVRNTGQSTLAWVTNAGAFPPWIELGEYVGTSGPDAESIVTVTINRDLLPEGENEFVIEFSADFADPITLTIAAEGLPDPP